MDGSVKDLTNGIASGNAEAFTRFFREWFSYMYAEARRATKRDESFCLDVVQDAMIRVIRSMRPMDAEHRLRAWLRVVVQTCAYDRLRMEIRLQRREQRAMAGSECTGVSDDTAERLDWLQNELAALDEPQVQLLVLRYRLGWTLQRIGRVLGIKPGAVDGRVNRTIATLRRRAGETFDE